MNRTRRSLFTPEGVLLTGFFLMVLVRGAAASNETVPPDSYVYRGLRAFELLGLVHLKPEIPYRRSDVERYVREIDEAIAARGVALTPRQDFILDRLRDEFVGKALEPRQRENPPLYTYQRGDRFFAIEFPVGAAWLKKPDTVKGRLDGLGYPGVLFHLGSSVTMETRYRCRLAPEWGLNADREKPGPRVKSWRGFTAEYERAYLAFGGSKWNMLLGRDYIHWGPILFDGLLMSRTAASHDQLSASVEIGRFGLSVAHVQLDPVIPRHLAGHRLTVRLPRGIWLGIAETIIYTHRDFDFAYLLPLGFYYASQFNERGDDNILWSIDLKVPAGKGLLFSGELIVDDLQYENDPPAPSRLAYNITAEALVMPGGHDVELLASYTFVDIYTYAHRDSLLTRYIAGGGDPAFDFPIGSRLGPDADRWFFRVGSPVHRRVLLGAEGHYIRRGEGNDYREWYPGMDHHPPFPSGEVLTERLAAVLCEADLSHGSVLSVGIGWRKRSGRGVDDSEVFGSIEFIWDF